MLNERYFQLLESEIASEPSYRVMPGVEALLLTLQSRNACALGLQTGNLWPAVQPKLRRGGLDGFFL